MTKEELQAKFAEKFPKADKAEVEVKDYLTMRLPEAAMLTSVITWLRDDLGFNYLDMVSATDQLGPINLDGFIREPNPNVFLPDGATPQVAPPAKHKDYPYREAIELVYLLTNLTNDLKVFVKVDIPRDGGSAPSLISLYPAADWQERELFDLYGVNFEGHPNLTKILTPDFMQGNPLRKDYAHIKDRFDD